MSDFPLASLDTLARENRRHCLPPPRLRLDEWADSNFYLSPENSAHAGPWRCLPYQREVLRAMSDPRVERVTWQASSRVGKTKCMVALVAFHMAHDPCSVMLVQPTLDVAEAFSRDEISPMLRDVVAVRGLVAEGHKMSANTLRNKLFPGGKLILGGANNATAFQRVTVRILLLDEADKYAANAGGEGDPVELAITRTKDSAMRKIVVVSTPLLENSSRVRKLFEEGDQRRYYVPCTHCGHFDILVFHQEADGVGHRMRWPKDDPDGAYFQCSRCSGAIEHKDKRRIVEAGEWRAAQPFTGHASFHCWAAYGYQPNATWGHIATEFVRAGHDATKLQAFFNTTLGETWSQRGEAPSWQRLFERREGYPIGKVPVGGQLLTAGVDVQKGRLVYEVVAWGADKESWSVEADVIPGDTGLSTTPIWAELDKLLMREWPCADGRFLTIANLGIDSGYNTHAVYEWASRHPGVVLACDGRDTGATLLGMPKRVGSVLGSGKRLSREVLLWPVNVSKAKVELYACLQLAAPDLDQDAPGWCHFPDYPREFFQELTAEELVEARRKDGTTESSWVKLAGRENHSLDCRNYARAAAARARIDLLKSLVAPSAPSSPSAPPIAAPPQPPARRQPQSGFWGSRRGSLW